MNIRSNHSGGWKAAREGVLAVLATALFTSQAAAFNIGGSGGSKAAVKPMILFGFQRYEANRNGIYRPTTAIGDDHPSGVAFDANGNLYVANGGTNMIAVYAPGAGSGATPAAILAGPDTGLNGFGFSPVATDAKGNLYVMTSPPNFQTSATTILVYAPGASGDALPVATISPSITVLNDPSSMAVDGAGNIYVTNTLGYVTNTLGPSVNVTPGSVVVFGARARAIPKATISGAPTGLVTPGAIAVDNEGRIYVANEGRVAAQTGLGPDASSIVVFGSGSRGNAKPIAEISGPATGLGQQVTALAVDASGNIYVGSARTTSPGGSVATLAGGARDQLVPRPTPVPKGFPTTQFQMQEFAAGSNGNVAPIAMIAGSSTGLSNPAGIVVDAAGRIYVANTGDNKVTVYSPGSSGDVQPIATLSRGDSGARGPLMGLTFDTSGNTYALMRTSDSTDAVREWAAGSTDAPPLRDITFPPPLDNTPLGLAVDATGNVYVGMPPANGSTSDTALGSVVEYAAGASGDAQPSRTITGADTGLGLPTGVTVDRSGNIYVSSFLDAGAVSVFSPGADGDATPLQLISGSDTLLSSPETIALDAKDDIYVGNTEPPPPKPGSRPGPTPGPKPRPTPAPRSGHDASWGWQSLAGRDGYSGLARRSWAPASNSTPRVPLLTIYGPGSSDNAAPEAALPVTADFGLAVDASGNIYVANGFSISVFPPGATSTTKPAAAFTTPLGGPYMAVFPAAQP